MEERAKRTAENEPLVRASFPLKPARAGERISADTIKHRADILFCNSDALNLPTLADITIRHPTEDVIRMYKPAGHTITDLLKYRGLAAKSGYVEKMKFYSSRYNIRQGGILPISIDTYGYLHDEPYKFLRKYVNNRASFRAVIEGLSYASKMSAGKSILKYLDLIETTSLSASKARRRAAVAF